MAKRQRLTKDEAVRTLTKVLDTIETLSIRTSARIKEFSDEDWAAIDGLSGYVTRVIEHLEGIDP